MHKYDQNAIPHFGVYAGSPKGYCAACLEKKRLYSYSLAASSRRSCRGLVEIQCRVPLETLRGRKKLQTSYSEQRAVLIYCSCAKCADNY